MACHCQGHRRWQNRYIDRIVKGSKQDAVDFEATASTRFARVSKMTFGSYLSEKWIPSLKVEDNTLRYYTQAMPSLASLAPVPLCDLTPIMIEEAVRELSTPSVRARAKRTLSASLRTAYRWGMTSENLMERVKIDGTTKPRRAPEAYSLGVPRIRGGDPLVQHFLARGVLCSPHTRG
ncbi:MAG: hypothetical protein FWD27_02400 [Coriobacteriia bacterium]|nr:hypothetical protein [Coriobacteriia bacterium]